MTAITRSPSPRRRQGFTLVEVLVAMALIIFIMVILTEAFSAGIGVFRALKSAGDMQERLRATESLLRDDLVHYHFGNGEKLSTLTATAPPTAGYFYLLQNPSVDEGADGYGVHSYRMNATPPALCFTVNLYTPPGTPPALSDKGFLPNDFFVARIPDFPGGPGPLPALGATEAPLFSCGPTDYLPAPLLPRGAPNNNVFLSQWAEVAYFLVATGKSAGTTTSQPLYSLRRRVRVILNPGAGTAEATAATTLNTSGPRILNTPVPSAPVATDVYNARYAEMSCFPEPATGNLYFNSPSDLWSTPGNRMYNRPVTPFPSIPPSPLGPIGTPPPMGQGQLGWAGDDLVITDVISFNVRLLFTGATATDFADLTSLGGTYDSSTMTAAGALTPVSALEITIRVWDVKTSLARQITIIQDM